MNGRDPERTPWFRLALAALVLVSLLFIQDIERQAEAWIAGKEAGRHANVR